MFLMGSLLPPPLAVLAALPYSEPHQMCPFTQTNTMDQKMKFKKASA